MLHALNSLQLQLLEEELVGRRSYWRRQRHREDELTATQAQLVKKMLEDENVTAQIVSEKQETINESKQNLLVIFKGAW